MKTLLSILIILCGLGANAQQEIQIRNNTTMDLDFVFFVYDNSSCSQITTFTISVPPGFDVTPLLPSTEEYVWVEISPTSCSWFGLTVGTPMQCNSLCQEPGIPFFTNGVSCSGNYSFVQARWSDCGPVGVGFLEVNEF